MSAYQCWCTQRERLRESLKWAEQPAAIASAIRHTISQVEQNTMAELTDDLLRQQVGILFSSCKTSLNLLDLSVTSQVWVAQATALKPKNRTGILLLAAAALLALVAVGFSYNKGLWELYIPIAAAIAFAAIGILFQRRSFRREGQASQDRLKVTSRPDTEKLLAALDAQMRALDRFMNDFAYLNEQNVQPDALPDSGSIPLLAALLEAIYACEGETGEDAAVAAARLLDNLGLNPVCYRPEDARLFTVLPSLSETRTLAPALISRKDGALLYRGTAAVQTSNAENATSAPGMLESREVLP